MKKFILLVSMALTATLAMAQENTGKTLYLVDGVISQKEMVDALPADLIGSMDVIKGVESVVVITTKSKMAEAPKITMRRQVEGNANANDPTITVRANSAVDIAGVSPLCVVKTPDGKLSKGDLPSISPDTIKSIHVFKDDQVEPYRRFGDTTNGVVLVELK